MTFFTGMLVGGILLYAAMHYHLIRANDGLHLVRKTGPRLAATYVDIRRFGIADWAKYTEVAAALINSDRRDLVENAAGDALQQGFDGLLDRSAPRDK